MKNLIVVVLLLATVAVFKAQVPDCHRVTPTSGCFCNATVDCPKDINLRCNLVDSACEVFFDDTNTFYPCTNDLCPLENQFCYYGWCVFVPFVVRSTLPTLLFTKPTLVFTTPKPVTKRVTRKPIFIRPVRPCVDFVHPGRCFSDCPSRRHLCDNAIYYDVMTMQCPKTCNRCYDNFNIRCPYGMGGNRGGYPYPGQSYPRSSLPMPYNPCNGIMGH
ncbi:hypothetical protein QR680_004651 [Steinernema hermaphroditum]|uniref:ShKT domain-containing protein n=1 Tax=Steinernema hermaphroditum TaxID=289476 RepID=A0AA39LUB6_9BILA|nr:hypothetical protein QR680_004651 [Steinernema hermaphroditum]